MAANMSQSNELILSDKTVSRMMAERAVQHPEFKDLLSRFVHAVNNGRSRPKNFNTIVSIISKYRDQIADQMELRAPINEAGGSQVLTTYLKQNTLSRVLVSKHATQEEKGHEAASEQMEFEWMWVVSHQACSKVLPKLTLDLGTAGMHCTLGFCVPTVHAPVPSRPYTFPL